jgi:mannosyltransferase
MNLPETVDNQKKNLQSSPQRLNWIDALALTVLMASAAVLRLWRLDWKPFWYDECYSVELARIHWSSFLRLLWWREANMSLYYVLLRLWIHLGQSPIFIRSLSAVLAAATVPALFWLARMLYDRRIALFAAALFTVNAYHLRYSQEARSYTLFVLLSTLSSAFLIAWLRQPERQSYLGYVVTSILAVYAHFYALLLLIAQWLVVRGLGIPRKPVDDQDRTALRRAWTIIGVAVLPLLVFVAKTGAGPIRWIQRPGWSDLLTFAEHLAGGNLWVLLAMGAACVAAVAPLGKTLLLRKQAWNVWRCQFLLVWLLFPVVLTVVLSFARPVFLARYMIFCLPALLILAAAGVATLRPPFSAAALTCILLLAWPGTLFVYQHDFDDERDASGAATNFVLDHAQAGDAIIFHIAATRVAYEFFRSLRSGQDTASPSFSGQFGPEILFPHHGPGLDYRDFTGKPIPEFLRDALPEHPRVWVMLMNNGSADKPDVTTTMLTRLLPESFPRVQTWQFHRVQVRLYSKE